MVQQLKIKSKMEDNGYLEQAAALLDKAKEAGEVGAYVLSTSGRKVTFRVDGKHAQLLNALINMYGPNKRFNRRLAVAVAAIMLKDEKFALKIAMIRAYPAELMKHLKMCSEALDAEIAEAMSKSEGLEEETEKEESHDSEEAA